MHGEQRVTITFAEAYIQTVFRLHLLGMLSAIRHHVQTFYNHRYVRMRTNPPAGLKSENFATYL